MTDVYEKAVQALEECAKSEEKLDPAITLTLPLSVAISVYCEVNLAIRELEERISSDPANEPARSFSA